MTLKEEEIAIVEEFAMFDEWLDKYEYLIDLGKNLPIIPEESKSDDKFGSIQNLKMENYFFKLIVTL